MSGWRGDETRSRSRVVRNIVPISPASPFNRHLIAIIAKLIAKKGER